MNASRVLSILIATVVLVACGGGGDSPAPPRTGVFAPGTGVSVSGTGVVGGVIVGRADPSFIAVSDGSATILFYGPDLAAAPQVTGSILVLESYAQSPGDPYSYNASDTAQGYGYGASVSLSIDPIAPSVTGVLRYRDQSSTYQLTGGPVPGSSYRYNRPADMADMVGTWSLSDMQANPVSLSVREDGGVSGNYQGCMLSGTVKPDLAGVNRMSLQINIACASSGTSDTYDGVAVAFPIDAGGTQLLIWATWSGAWDTSHFFAIGRR